MASTATYHASPNVSLLGKASNAGNRKFRAPTQACSALPSRWSGHCSAKRVLSMQGGNTGLRVKPMVLSSKFENGAARRSSLQVTAAVQDVKSENDISLSTLGKYFAGTLALALGGAVAGMYIDQFTDLPCMATQSCKPISDVMKALLIGTHLYNFMLLPATMFVLYWRLPSLVKGDVRSPFTMSLGVAYMMVSMAGEIGWHVTQEWYYHDEYMVLNLVFYVFLNLGLGLWAWGMKIEEPGKEESTLSKAVDYFLLASPVLTILFYLLGAEFTHTKLPIFITTSGIFVALTYRYWKLLNTWLVLGFPFFSVGVNLFFISKLNEHGTDAFLNPLYHICHDALGTMLGMAYITVLTYVRPIEGYTDTGVTNASEDVKDA